jgi:hypothetical protein
LSAPFHRWTLELLCFALSTLCSLTHIFYSFQSRAEHFAAQFVSHGAWMHSASVTCVLNPAGSLFAKKVVDGMHRTKGYQLNQLALGNIVTPTEKLHELFFEYKDENEFINYDFDDVPALISSDDEDEDVHELTSDSDDENTDVLKIVRSMKTMLTIESDSYEYVASSRVSPPPTFFLLRPPTSIEQVQRDYARFCQQQQQL